MSGVSQKDTHDRSPSGFCDFRRARCGAPTAGPRHFSTCRGCPAPTRPPGPTSAAGRPSSSSSPHTGWPRHGRRARTNAAPRSAKPIVRSFDASSDAPPRGLQPGPDGVRRSPVIGASVTPLFLKRSTPSGSNLCSRSEALTDRMVRVFAAPHRAELRFVHGPFQCATVNASCSCGSRNFRCPHPVLPDGSTSVFPVISGGVIIAATRCPRSADSDVLPQGDMTWLLVP